MNIYFIRHGKSIFHDRVSFNEKKHQFPNTPLSEIGIQQATKLAKKFEYIPIDVILTSTYQRAIQTAQAIKKVNPVPVIQSELLIERKMPSSFLGKATDDPEIVPIHETIREHFYEASWHYTDEENFTDLLERAKEACNLILSQQKEQTLVVTHGYFLTVILFFILFGDKTNPHLFKAFREHITNQTAGVTYCEYKKNSWKLITWNDTEHLEK